jgi:hypothetical protein
MRTTVVNTIILAKLWYVASVLDFTKRFYKEVDRIIFAFLWRSTEWIARNMLVNARCHGGLGVTHAQAKVKAIRLMQVLQVLRDPDKTSSVLARRWIGVRLREWFFIKPSRPVVFVLQCDGIYKSVLKDFKICQDLGKQWMEEATTAKMYIETLKLFKKQPNVESKNIHIQYAFIWYEFDLYPISLESKEVWFKILHQVLTVRQVMFKLKIINTCLCPLCGKQAESIEHLFILCDKIQSVKR